MKNNPIARSFDPCGVEKKAKKRKGITVLNRGFYPRLSGFDPFGVYNG
jgi:hypothetical protein